MKTLINIAVKRPITIIMLYLALGLFGIISAFNLGIDFLPEIIIPRLVISTGYPGLPPEQIRELITIPLEDALTSLKGIKKISSISREGVSSLELEFHWGINMDMAAVEAREIIDTTYPVLPSEAEKPLVLPVNPGEIPVLTLAVFPRAGDLPLARRLAERELKTRLQQIDGVGAVIMVGGRSREVRVEVDQALAAAKGITLDQIVSLLQQSNIDFPTGSLKEGTMEYIIKTDGKVHNRDQLGELFISGNGQTRVRLKHIAKIEEKNKERRSLFHVDGQEAVGLLIHRKGGMSPVTLARNVRSELDSLNHSYAADISLRLIKDSSLFISQSIHDLLFSALAGAGIAFLVLILFMRKLRISLILISSIPFSILSALLLLKVSGCTLNTMSLGGLALGVGMLVDNSVVVLENLQKNMISGACNRREYVIQHTARMAGSTFGSTVTSLVVFLPIIFLPGILGLLFTDLALAVIFSLLASYFVSVTLVPVLFLLSWRQDSAVADSPGTIEKKYRRLLRPAFRHPRLLAAVILLLFIPGGLTFMGLNFEFMPDVDQRELDVEVMLPPGTNLEHASFVSSELADRIRRHPLVETVYSRAGGEAEDTYYLADPEKTREIIYLHIKLSKEAAGKSREMRELFSGTLYVENGDLSVSLPENIITPLLGIRTGETVLQVTGEDPAQAAARGEEILYYLQELGKEIRLTRIPRGKKPLLSLIPDREQIAHSGTTLAEIARTVGTAVTGMTATKLTSAGKEIDVRVMLQEKDRGTEEKLEELQVRNPAGNLLVLKDLVTLTEKDSTPALLRENRKDMIIIKAGFPPEKQKTVEREFTHIRSLFPFAGSLESSELRQNMRRILLIFTLVLALLYLVLGAQFESFLLPLFLMLSLPLSLSGIFIALYLCGESLNLNSILGILVLLGIVVNNSIILFENYKQQIADGKQILPAIYRGSSERIRPILITMFTTITALLPLAVDITGTQAQSSMAVALIGGLFVSTSLTLFVTPLMFYAYFKRVQRRPS